MTAVVQVILVQFANVVFSTAPLDLWDWIATILIGFVSIPLGVIQRFLPVMPMDKWWSAILDVVFPKRNTKVHPDTPSEDDVHSVGGGAK